MSGWVLAVRRADAVVATRGEDGSSTRTEHSEQETQSHRIFLRDSSLEKSTRACVDRLRDDFHADHVVEPAKVPVVRSWPAAGIHPKRIAANDVVGDRGRVRPGYTVLGPVTCSLGWVVQAEARVYRLRSDGRPGHTVKVGDGRLQIVLY